MKAGGSSGGGGLSLRSLSLPDLARLLHQAGSVHATRANVAADVAAGAPATGDRVDVIEFGAWLVRSGGG